MMSMSNNQQSFFLRWNNHHQALVQEFDNLLLNKSLVDCTLAAEGQYIHAHKVVLSAASPYLQLLLSQHYEKHPIILLKDIRFQELKSMIEYMYKGEVNIAQDQLGRFLKSSESLQIKGLNQSSEGFSTFEESYESNHFSQSLMLPSLGVSDEVLPMLPTGSEPENLPIRSCKNRITRSSSKHQERLSKQVTCNKCSSSFDCKNNSMPISVIDDSIRTVPSDSSNTATNIPHLVEDSRDLEIENELVFIEPKIELISEPFNNHVDVLTMGDDNNCYASISCNMALSCDEINTSNHQNVELPPICVPNDQLGKMRSPKTFKKPLKKTLKKARKTRSGKIGTVSHPCLNKCGKSYQSKASMERHFTVECGKEPLFHCPHCLNKFFYKKSLQMHMNRHK